MRRALLVSLFVLVFCTSTMASAQQGWRPGWTPSHEVHTQVRNLRTPLYRCYTSHVPEASRMHGDIVTLRVVVSEAGNVFRVDFLEGSTRWPKFEKCVRALFEGLKFATKPSEKMKFVQKLGFQNGLDKLLIEPPKAAGGAITKESVTELAKQNKERIDACYKQGLSQNPNLRGQVLVEIVVDGKSGTVKSARVVKTTLANSTVESCVVGVVQSFYFGVPDDPGIVILQYPLTFDDAQ